jgi:UDP-sulfoquinovose synthase
MRILILGGDGYLGWPTAMYLSRRGHTIGVADSYIKRRWEQELGIEPLFPIRSLPERVQVWEALSGHRVTLFEGDLTDYDFVRRTLDAFRPEAIIHYGEQPSAPFSMMNVERCVQTQVNNVVGTLNVLWAMREVAPACHLVKLGTLGEYGTPNIDIEEGFIEIEHKGRRDVLPYPKQPGSFYHLSKVHDSHNIMFACRVWKLASTDLNQGVVYGLETEETAADPRLATSFHYDSIFGTVLNRFCVQAAAGIPLTVYGQGAQKRGFLNIRDTLRCVELALLHPAAPGQYRVFNQFTEIFSVNELAELVAASARQLGLPGEIQHLRNPRVEKEDHYYQVTNSGLLQLGLRPHRLSNELVDTMLKTVMRFRARIRPEIIRPGVAWHDGDAAAELGPSVAVGSAVGQSA